MIFVVFHHNYGSVLYRYQYITNVSHWLINIGSSRLTANDLKFANSRIPGALIEVLISRSLECDLYQK